MKFNISFPNTADIKIHGLRTIAFFWTNFESELSNKHIYKSQSLRT